MEPIEQKMVSIIVPVYNEQENIGEFLARLMGKIRPIDEILLVNDASTDATERIVSEYVRRYPQNIRLIQHPYNIGNGAAIKTGIRHSHGDILVFMDGDGQHNPDDISRLLADIGEYDMVIGARTKDSEAHWHRNLANRIYNALASYVTKFPIKDLTSGFRVIRREAARNFLYLLPNTFSYPTTLTLSLLRTGRAVKYVPIKTAFRKGKSKIRLFSDGARFFLIIVKIATLFSPFRIFLPISLLFFLLGLGYYGYTFLDSHRFTNMSQLMLVTSVIIFMLGLVSEQIAQLRMDRSEGDN
jgi:glycosyltransferase involved in cell wall biosynthesis